MLFRKAFKVRLYPTPEQVSALAIQFGHKRYVYNYFLHRRKEHYKEEGETLTYHQCALELTRLKARKDHQWLKQAHSQVLQQALKDLNSAFKNFFEKRANYPKFKRKSHQQSIRFPQGFQLVDGFLKLPKLGLLKAQLHRDLEGVPKNVTITKTKSGQYFASLQVEFELTPTFVERGVVGLDLGLPHLVTLSDGTKIPNPRWFRSSEEQLKKLHRELSRKEKGSQNWHKARKELAKAYERLRRQREDFWHKLSYQLVREYHLLCVEDLNVKGMVQNRRLSKSIQDASWSTFVRYLKYKAPWYGSYVQEVGRWFASSKLCSGCGAKREKLELSERSWVCECCGKRHEREQNAALNILAEGVRLFGENEEAPVFLKGEERG